MKALAIVLMAGLAMPAAALECSQENAAYEQPGGQVKLHFSKVARDSAANQIAAFSINIENIDSAFTGEIYIPNGFGQPRGYLGLNCADEISETCQLWEGLVYALGKDGIEEFPWDPNSPRNAQAAPQQVLLPGLAADLWYSMERPIAFEGDRTVIDVFSLVACDE